MSWNIGGILDAAKEGKKGLEGSISLAGRFPPEKKAFEDADTDRPFKDKGEENGKGVLSDPLLQLGGKALGYAASPVSTIKEEASQKRRWMGGGKGAWKASTIMAKIGKKRRKFAESRDDKETRGKDQVSHRQTEEKKEER